MGKATQPKIRHLPKDFDRKAEQVLARIQPGLLPEHADKIVSINVTTGEYVVADTPRKSSRKFKERWPDEVSYQVRADGGPVARMPWAHGRGRPLECPTIHAVPPAYPRRTEMGKTTQPKIKILPKDFRRKAEQILARIQPELLPAQADKFLSINVTTGEYVAADTLRESTRAFRERWPDEVAFQVRADGGPVEKLSWV